MGPGLTLELAQTLWVREPFSGFFGANNFAKIPGPAGLGVFTTGFGRGFGEGFGFATSGLGSGNGSGTFAGNGEDFTELSRTVPSVGFIGFLGGGFQAVLNLDKNPPVLVCEEIGFGLIGAGFGAGALAGGIFFGSSFGLDLVRDSFINAGPSASAAAFQPLFHPVPENSYFQPVLLLFLVRALAQE